MNGRNLIFFPPTPLNARVANLEKHADFRRLFHYEPILDGLKPLIGDVASFSRSSAATYIDDNGVLQYAAVNEQRYQGGGGMFEPERENMVEYSEAFDWAGWNKVNSQVTTAYAVGPDGETSGVRLFRSTSGTLDIRRSFTLSAATDYCASIFVKKTTGATTFPLFTFGSSIGGAVLDTNTGVVKGYTANPAVRFGVVSDVEGYWRLWISGDSGAGGGTSFTFYPAGSTDGESFTPSLDGEATIFGAQVEPGRYPTSYIFTDGSPETRSADVFSAPRPAGLSVQEDFTALIAAVPLFGDEEGVSAGFFLMGDSAPRIRVPYPSYSPDEYVLMLDGFSVDSVHNLSSGTFGARENVDAFILSDADGDLEYTVYENGTPSDTESKAWDEVKDDEDEFGGSMIIEYYKEAWILKSLIVTSGLMTYDRIKSYQRA